MVSYKLKDQFKRLLLGSVLITACTSISAQNSDDPTPKIQHIAIKTNILHDAAMIPNIGVELCFPQQWSLNASWNCAWWDNNSKHRYWRTYGGEIEARKWHGRLAREYPLRGHHTGLFMMAGMYDFEWGHAGYMNDLYYGIGVSYGYAVKLARNLTLDFGVGIGYLCGTYYKYRPQDNGYCVMSRRNLSYFGPIKAEVSLVWTLDDIFKCMKGDRR